MKNKYMSSRYIVALLLGMICLLPVGLMAKTDYRQNYNYTRAMEFWRKDDAKCKEWLLKEIESCAQNGYAHYRLSAIYRNEKEYGNALNAANQAVNLLKKDKEWSAWTYQERAWVYMRLADTISALRDLDEAIRLAPKEKSFLESRGDLLMDLGRYDESRRDYLKYTEFAPGDAMGFACLGHIAAYEKDYDEAIRQYNYSMKLSPSYAYPYRLRAEAYAKQSKWRESVDDVISCLQLRSDDQPAFTIVEMLADSAYQLLTIKMKAQYRKDPTNAYWPMLLSQIASRRERYAEALKYSQAAFDVSGSPVMARSLANSYVMLGQYKEGIDMMNRACEIDTADVDLIYNRGSIKDEASMYEEAIVDYDRCIAAQPDNASCYEAKASCLERLGKIDEALETLEMALAHDPESPHANLLQGKLLGLKGDKEGAEPFLRKAIENDKNTRSLHHTMYAYLYLQQYDSLETVQTRLLAQDADRPVNSNLYNVSCLYALRGDTVKCLDYLKQSLEAGFVSFNHARKDPDFGSLLQDTRFIDLIAEYENCFAEKQGIVLQKPEAEAKMEGESSEIPFTKEGGVCKVKCTINDLPLYFIFDTGASDVTMSTVEATFMFKNGYLASSDITGKEYFQTATGEISEGTIVMLRKVVFGGVTLTNVKASVVSTQNAPLLLGQSVLSRLGHIEIDNAKKLIRITK